MLCVTYRYNSHFFPSPSRSGGVLSKEGYYSLKKRLHYAMIPMRGSDARAIEDRCIGTPCAPVLITTHAVTHHCHSHHKPPSQSSHIPDADWAVDSKAFSPLNQDNFHFLMFDTLEAWIDMEHDKNFVSAFAFMLFMTISDTHYSPARLRPLRQVKCITTMKEIHILKVGRRVWTYRT